MRAAADLNPAAQVVVCAGQADTALAEILGNPEGDEGALKDIGVEAVFAQRFDELDDMVDLAGVDDAQAIDVPMHGITDLADPPVVVFAEPDYAPFELRSAFRHWVVADFAARKGGHSALVKS